MGFLIKLRFRGAFIVVVFLGVFLCSVSCYSSVPASSDKVRIVLTREDLENLQNAYNGYHHTNEDSDGIRRLERREPPTTDDDFVEKRRGALDPHGRSVIFKSLVVVPLLLVLLAIFLVALFPIPVISSPIGRSIKQSAYATSMQTLKMARDVLTSEECVERVSCELSKISRTYESTSWIPVTLEKLLVKAKWSERIIRGLHGISPSACTQFTCRPAKHFNRTLKSAVVTQ